MADGRVAMIATVKDEGPYLLEWIAHHLALGFDGIVVASNDCTDGTDHMLDRLAELGHLTHFDNYPPYKNIGINIQTAAYARARRYPAVATADWVITLDADEFLNIKVGAGRIPDLLAVLPDDADLVPICWRMFGDNGLTGWIDAPLTDVQTRAATPQNNQNQCKSLIRDHIRWPIFGPHRPREVADTDPSKRIHSQMYYPHGVRVKEDNEMHPYRGRFRIVAASWAVAQINHHFVRTWETFKLKAFRGNVFRPVPENIFDDPRYSRERYDEFNTNDEEDVSIHRTKPARDRILAELMADPVLARLHAAACASAKERLQAIGMV
ncbi:glycosyltransferase family 2 protein [Acuticoccus sp. M5D2P5]|uniref:glycosyltransferase family 2 protein n=1 Tax=Acuticoccus kalidii TaxID=2910977 RepID=UPI001F231C8B|nr:glycosyltransferase family 2 protein [Acuticoccus kalidii]MCF3932314.1 glycosyltransferase family 2 protein [Acuticoccus kalidii]